MRTAVAGLVLVAAVLGALLAARLGGDEPEPATEIELRAREPSSRAETPEFDPGAAPVQAPAPPRAGVDGGEDAEREDDEDDRVGSNDDDR